jgi:Mrp family chromosome partitioning ATPase
MLASAADHNCALAAAGLALVLAEEGCRTLLVDANLRAPQLHHVFTVDGALGFAHMLAISTAEYPLVTPICDSFWVLPAGKTSRDTASLFRRPALGAIVQALAQRFDTVIYTIGAGANCSDALLLGQHVGSAVLMIRTGVDTTEDIMRIKEPIERAGVEILGFTMVGG